jgi:hypothetical protein
MNLGVSVEAPLVSRKNSFGIVEFSATHDIGKSVFV